MLDWLQNFLKGRERIRLGIDLGSSAIKLVEISAPDKNEPLNLETYGVASFGLESLRLHYLDSSQETGGAGEQRQKGPEPRSEKWADQIGRQRSIFNALSAREIGRVLKELLVQSGVKTRSARFSLPLFASFFTIIELPYMPENEVAAAVPYEAKRYIPVPLEEVVLDWNIISQPIVSLPQPGTQEQLTDEERAGLPEKKEGGIQVSLFAILKDVMEKYVEVAQAADLKIHSLESESFSLMRALVGQTKDPILLLDIGFSSANIVLVDDGTIRIVHSVKMAINQDTGALDRGLLLKEIQKALLSYNFKQSSASDAGGQGPRGVKCFISGGGGIEPHFVDYLGKGLDIKALTANPFTAVKYPEALEPKLKALGPSLTVAFGLAMKE